MINKARKLIKDILFVSKITNVTGKKRTIIVQSYLLRFQL